MPFNPRKRVNKLSRTALSGLLTPTPYTISQNGKTRSDCHRKSLTSGQTTEVKIREIRDARSRFRRGIKYDLDSRRLVGVMTSASTARIRMLQPWQCPREKSAVSRKPEVQLVCVCFASFLFFLLLWLLGWTNVP